MTPPAPECSAFLKLLASSSRNQDISGGGVRNGTLLVPIRLNCENKSASSADRSRAYLLLCFHPTSPGMYGYRDPLSLRAEVKPHGKACPLYRAFIGRCWGLFPATHLEIRLKPALFTLPLFHGSNLYERSIKG